MGCGQTKFKQEDVSLVNRSKLNRRNHKSNTNNNEDDDDDNDEEEEEDFNEW